MNEEYERGYEDGFIDGVKKNSESRVSKFLEKHSEPVWVGLTDEEIYGLGWMDDMSLEEEVELIREAEIKLKEKNNG